MPPRGRNRRPKRGLSGAFIVMGIMSLLYSGVFPLFRLFDYAVLALVMLGAGKIYRAVVKKIHQKEDEAAEEEERRERQREEYARKRREAEEKRKAEQAKATTGDAAVDSLILRGQQLLEQIRSENDRLPEPEISEQIDTIESIANQIFKAVIEQPKKAPQIRRFMDYYLPTTLKMLVAFRRMEEGNVTGESADNARQRIRESLDMVIEAFNKQLARLYEDDALDITTDIDVLETMLSEVYHPSGDDNRYTFVGGSTTGGLVIYDDKYAYSHHATDPAGGSCATPSIWCAGICSRRAARPRTAPRSVMMPIP